MEVRQMRQFVAVAEELHFGRAANRLGMAQPPLSQAIKRLEDELGVRLLDRTKRAVWLTDAGAAFLEEARRALLQVNLAKTVAQRIATADSERINVSFIGPAMFRLLPDLLVLHRREQPNVDIRLFERSSPEQMEAVLSGETDIAFVHPTTDIIEGGDSLLVERCAIMVAAHRDLPIAQRASVRVEDLADQPLIMAPKGISPSRASALMAIFRAAGFTPRIVQEANQTNTVLSLIGANVGIGLVPATAQLPGWSQIHFLPIEDAPSTLRWELAMIWRPDHLSRSAAAFVRMVHDFLSAHPEYLDVHAPVLPS